MPIIFRCGGCKKKLSVGSRMKGANVKCPACQKTILVPVGSTSNLTICASEPKPIRKTAGVGTRHGWLQIAVFFGCASLASLSIAIPIVLMDRKDTHVRNVVLETIERRETPTVTGDSIESSASLRLPEATSNGIFAESPFQKTDFNEPTVELSTSSSSQTFATQVDLESDLKSPVQEEPLVPTKYVELATQDEDVLHDRFLNAPLVFYDQQFFEEVVLKRITASGNRHFDSIQMLDRYPEIAGLPWIFDARELEQAEATSLREIGFHVRSRAPVNFFVTERVLSTKHRMAKSAELETLRREIIDGINKYELEFGGLTGHGFTAGVFDIEVLRSELAVPALEQLLMATDRPARTLLVKAMAQINHPSATLAIARRAVYDLSREVRRLAIKELANRPEGQYREILRVGLSYPSLDIAMQAADAIAELNATSLRPDIQNMLEDPPPNQPFKLERDGGELEVVREVVRVHHSSNCVLCHKFDGLSAGKFSAAIPSTPQSLVPRVAFESFSSNPSLAPYYEKRATGDLFVDPNVTLIRQDFALQQPVRGAENSTVPTQSLVFEANNEVAAPNTRSKRSKKYNSSKSVTPTSLAPKSSLRVENLQDETGSLVNVQDPSEGDFVNRFDYFVRIRPATESDFTKSQDTNVEYRNILRRLLAHLPSTSRFGN